jgi:hypothetical protein
MLSDLARTSAHALASILREVRKEAGRRSLRDCWSDVLDAQYGTLEFSRRHSQCHQLLLTTIESIDGLESRKRGRYIPYTYGWWYALNVSEAAWSNAVGGDAIISNVNLDMLDSLGDVQESAFTGTSISPAVDDLGQLQAAVLDLVQLVNGSTELSSNVKRMLALQLEQIEWLITNAHLFGLSAPVVAAENVMGKVATASASVTDPVEHATWKKKLTALGIAIMASCGVAQAGATAIAATMDSVAGVIESTEGLVDQVTGSEVGEQGSAGGS